MSFLSGQFWPKFQYNLVSGPTYTTRRLDAIADQMSIIFCMPEDDTIDKLYFRQGALTGGVGLTLSVGLQEVSSATGLTANTWMGGGTAFTFGQSIDVYNGAGTLLTTTNNNTFIEFSLGSGIALSRGQFVALTMKPFDGAWTNTTNDITITSSMANMRPMGNLPYIYLSPSITASSNNQQFTPFILKSSTSNKSYSDYPFGTYTRVLLHSSSQTYDALGIKWKFPKNWGYTYKIRGARFNMSTNALLTSGIAYELQMLLMDEHYSTLQSKIIYSTYSADTNDFSRRIYYFDEDSLVNLQYGKEYNLALRVLDNQGSSTRYLRMGYFTPINISDVSAITEAEIKLILKFDSGAGGAWTSSNNIPAIDLLVD